MCTDKKLVPVYSATATISCIGYFIVLKILHSSKLFKKPHFLLIVYLSFSDCGYVLMSAIVYSALTLVHPGSSCDIVTRTAVYVAHVVFTVSCLLSVALTMNQFIAVKYGLRYESIVTVRKIKLLVMIFIFVSAIINGLVLIDESYVVILHTRMIRSRCLLNSMILVMSGGVMLINLIYCNKVSRHQMKRLTQMEIVSPYWRHRRRIRNEVTIITSVVIAVLLPQAIFYTKVQIRHDHSDGKWLAATRGMLQLFCALNPYLYLFTLKPLKMRVSKEIRRCFCNKSSSKRMEITISKSMVTLHSEMDEKAALPNELYTTEKPIVNKTDAAISAYRHAQREFCELKSTDIVNNKMSLGIYSKII